MLRITTVGANAVNYLVRGSNCGQHQHQAGVGVEAGVEPGVDRGIDRDSTDYYLSAAAHGEAPGRWMGRGLDMLGHVGEGEQVDEDMVRTVFGRLEHPDTGQPLGRRIANYKDFQERLDAALAAEPDATPDRQREIADSVRVGGRRSVAYYDWTFSPPKSFSVQYAALLSAGRHEEAQTLLRVQREAVAMAMDYAQEHAGYTRVGYHGRTVNGRSVGTYERVRGFVMSVWDHSTNREAEPQIHTHVAVLNRAVTDRDGKIRSLDGKAFAPIKMAAASIYERAVEDLSREYLGYEWVTRPDGKAREIAGADLDLAKQASTRREQVEERAAELIEAYVERHGREPSAAALKKIHQAATLETRKAKGPEAGPAAVASWGERHREQLQEQLATVEAAAERIRDFGHPDASWMPDPEDRHAVLSRAVADVQRQYPTWNVGNLTAAVDRQLLTTPGTAQERPAFVAGLVQEALRPGNEYGVLTLTPPDITIVPSELRRKEDGRLKFRPHIDEVYCTEAHLSTERLIVARAAQLTAPRVEGPDLQLLRTEIEAIQIGGKPIGRDQAEAIIGIASSGRAGDVLIGPAGAGKSTVVAALSQIWEDRFGGRVLGLATSQRATQVLAEEGMEAINTSQFLARFAPGPDGAAAQDSVRPGDLIVVDEAGMSNTPELARISQLVDAGGGKMLYTGDHGQLGAIGTGGMLKLLATDNGAYELAEVHRFRDAKDASKASSWEGDASLRLRAGDQRVLAEYEQRGRLRGGTVDQMQAEAMRAYLADTLAGHDSLLVVGSNQEAADLSQAIREELISLGRVSADTLAELRDKTKISVGDVIQARRNDWGIEVEGGGLVTNRLTYTVQGRDERGRLVVEDASGSKAYLPDSYVRQHVTLAYASTVHAAQGRTVDTAHALLGEKSLREDAYVALTRGRQRNTAYLTTDRAPDAHEQPLAVTPAEMMGAVLDRSGVAEAAELQMRAAREDGRSLAWIGTQWDLIASEYAHSRYGDTIADVLGQAHAAKLVAEPAYPALVRAVRLAEMAGHNAEALLREALGRGSLDSARSESAVLRERVVLRGKARTPEQVTDARDWTTLQAPLDGPVGQYLHELAVASSDRQADLAARVAQDMPQWARQHLGEPPAEPRQRQEWLRRAGVAAAYRELHAIPDDQLSIGAAPSRESEFHRALWQAAHRALGNPADSLDYDAASDAELREIRTRWQREQSWAPPFVAEELQAANERAQDYHQDAVLFRARLTTMTPGSPEHARTLAEVERVERQAAEYAEIAHTLDEVHRARQRWYAVTEPARVADQLAADELERRNLPAYPEPAPQPQQTALFDITTDYEPTTAATPPVSSRPGFIQLNPAPAIEAEPVEHVRWWQRWSDSIRALVTGRAEQDQAAAVDPAPHVEQRAVDPRPAAEQQALVDVGELGPQPASDVGDVRQDQEHEAELDQAVDVDQLALFDVEVHVEDRVRQQQLRAVAVPESEQVADREVQAVLHPEPTKAPAASKPEATLDERTTIAEALRAARAAEAQRLRRDAAEATRQALRDKAIAAENAAEKAAADARARDDRDRALDRNAKPDKPVERPAPERQQQAEAPHIELAPTPAAPKPAPKPAPKADPLGDDYLSRQRRPGPHHSGPGRRW